MRQLDWTAVDMQTASWLRCQHSLLFMGACAAVQALSAASQCFLLMCTQAPVRPTSVLGILECVTELLYKTVVAVVQALIAGGTFNGQLCIWDLGAVWGPSTGHLQHQRGGPPVSGCALPDRPCTTSTCRRLLSV